MSLQIWYPFNGNNKNYGASISAPNQTPEYTSGKIGQCAHLTTYFDMCEDSSVWNVNTHDVSFAGWFKFNKSEIEAVLNDYTYDSTYTTPTGTLIGYNSYGGFAITWKSNAMYPTKSFTGLKIFGTIRSSQLSGGKSTDYFNINFDEWTHIALTLNRTTHSFSLYKNGTLISSVTLPEFSDVSNISDCYININTVSGGNGPSFKIPMYVNDVRVYDHCLSYSEVKEISKALVAYYPLRNNITAYSNQIKNATYNIYNNYGVSASLTKLNETYMGCDVYRLSMTPTSSNIDSFKSDLWSHGVYGFSRTFSANTKYCYWMYYRPITYSDTVAGGTASNIGGWTEISPEYMGDGWYRSGQYRDGSVTSDKSDNIFFSMRSPSAVVDTPFVVDFACPSLVLYTDEIQDVGDYQEAFLGRVSDCSGYNRNGSVTTSSCPSVVNDSPRYSNSYHFDSNAKNLSLNSSFLPTFTTGSVEWWAKVVTNGSSGTLPFTGQSTSYYIAASSGWTGAFYNGTTSAASGYSIKYYIDGVEDDTPNGPDGKWHHYVVTGLDMSGWTALWLNNYGGSSSWNASDIYYSDIKFYNTVLSAEDVSSLYKTFAFIDTNRALHCYELKNNAENIFRTRSIERYASSLSGSYGQHGIRNSVPSILIEPAIFYYGSGDVRNDSVLKDYFLPNTQYKFDMWMDGDDVVYNGNNVACGFTIKYTDGTSDSTFVITGNKNSPIGFQHKTLITPAGKSIKGLNIYYYTSITVYYKMGSYILPLTNNTSLDKNGVFNDGYTTESEHAMGISKNGFSYADSIIEI